MSMQGKIKLFKLTSKQYPDKIWDTVNHFVYTTESREVVKEDKKFAKETNYNYGRQVDLGGYFCEIFLSDDKKALYKLEVCNDELHDYNMKHYYQPHVDKNVWQVEEVFSVTNDGKNIKALARIFERAVTEYVKWKKDIEKN